MTFDFGTYLESRSIGPFGSFHVQLLTGGFTNVTARVVFHDSIPLFGSPNAYSSAILKYAPPHLATDPSHSLSVSRQVIEARALELITGQEVRLDSSDGDLASRIAAEGREEGTSVQTSAFKEVLDRYPIIRLPTVIYHDKKESVLWIEDLGELKSVVDALDASNALPGYEELATQLGSFLAEFHRASKTIPAETVERLTILSNIATGGIWIYLVSLAKDALRDLPGLRDDDREELTKKLELSLQDSQKPRHRDEQFAMVALQNEPMPEDSGDENPCLGMVDFWPGSVLIGENWGACGLIDWEYFGESDEASELGMFLAHFHIATLRPSISRESVERLGNFISTMCQAYSAISPTVVQASSFKRRLLMCYGREMITSVSMSMSMYPSLDDAAARKVRMAGVRGIRAVPLEGGEPHIEALGHESGEAWLRRALGHLGFL